ncbi:Fe2OG dioxygenase domain-containing protein [Mycena sanguinolenta]|uniref:Fe2OG dioxygenase domain-containing protein n=1 Tax=Mycena sanguinolenta TaxID=230812 RepID=A0A8H6YJS7_9AGAR|nr:Fe2OG dioxygenase domain-containing protein [Mycena sanguinolenta]
MATVDEKIANLKEALSKSRPVCTGSSQISTEEATLVYGLKNDKSARWIDLANAAPAELNALSDACQKATFGRNQEDVLDETYRKAGQMSAKDFTIRFNVEKSGILAHVHARLLEGFNKSDKRIEAELYKLNVYGVAKHLCRFILQSAQGYTARRNHVRLARSNLYFAAAGAPGPALDLAPPDARDTSEIHSSLSALLNDMAFLPDGGILGFGLRHAYPVNSQTQLKKLKSSLKGVDALLVYTSEELFGLKTSLKAIYNDDDDGEIMLDEIAGDLDDCNIEEDIIRRLDEEFGSCGEIEDVTWVVKSSQVHLEATYVAYGNEPSLGHIYGDLVLLVDIPSAKNRD